MVLLVCVGFLVISYVVDDVICLGNLKFVYYGVVFYIKEIVFKCGIKVDEKVFVKGLDVM